MVRPSAPIDAVGQATSARAAARSFSTDTGCRQTVDCPCPSLSANTAGAICRQASQSMQVVSTNQGPGTLAG
jgi:hypothetical protein